VKKKPVERVHIKDKYYHNKLVAKRYQFMVRRDESVWEYHLRLFVTQYLPINCREKNNENPKITDGKSTLLDVRQRHVSIGIYFRFFFCDLPLRAKNFSLAAPL